MIIHPGWIRNIIAPPSCREVLIPARKCNVHGCPNSPHIHTYIHTYIHT